MATLPREEHSENLQSALRVLKHAHVIHRIFASNLQRKGHAYKASWTKETPALADLASRIKETDQCYLDYLPQVSPEDLEEVIDFTFPDGRHGRMSREEMLAHVVTHTGNHRGEAGRLLSELEPTAMRDVFAGYLHLSEPQRRQ